MIHAPLTLWVRIPLIRVLDTTLCEKVCQWLATGRWFSPVTSINKTDRHDITEILLKVALNTFNQTNPIKRHPIRDHVGSHIFKRTTNNKPTISWGISNEAHACRSSDQCTFRYFTYLNWIKGYLTRTHKKNLNYKDLNINYIGIIVELLPEYSLGFE